MELSKIKDRFKQLKQLHAERDQRMLDVQAIRAGDIDSVAPGLMPAAWPKSVVANFINSAAKDLAEVIAPLPAINCNASNVVDDALRRKADKRTQIASCYVEASRLQVQMYAGAENYVTYGFLPFRVEPYVRGQRPHISVEDPMGSYPEVDRFGVVTAFARRWSMQASRLAAMFPESAEMIRRAGGATGAGDGFLELVRWEDDRSTVLFIEECAEPLAVTRNPLGRCPVTLAVLPSFDGQHRGQFDEVIWVQIARAKMALLQLDAAEKAVGAPLVVPNDVQTLPFGPDAVIRTATPDKVGRVNIQVPPSVFAEGQQLDNEMRIGARYPEVRSGNIDASVITGKGVQALEGSFDTQVKTAQTMLTYALMDAISMCFEMDVILWPNVAKNITGNENGQPYVLKYTPIKDIKDDFTVSVDYGLMAGLDPNRAMVFGLQARSDNLISRAFMRRNLPFSLNATQEEEQVDIEHYRDALNQSIAAYVQAIPLLTQQGQDPGPIVQSMATVIQARRKGTPIEDAVIEAFKPEPPPEVPQGQEGPPGAGGGEGGPEVPLGYDAATGQMRGVPQGQAGAPPGGRPDVRTMMASLTSSGKANLTAGVMRRRTF